MSTNKSTYNVCIFGLGRIGFAYDLLSEEHEVFTHAKATMRHPRFNLVGGVDPDPSKREEFENFTGSKAFASASELDQETDVYVLACPTVVRLDLFRELVERKPKLILLEKPLAMTVAEAEELKSLSELHNVRLFVNYMRLCDPAVTDLGEKITRRVFGKAVGGTVYYSNGLYENGSHFLSLVIYLLGAPHQVVPLKVQISKSSGLVSADFGLDYGDAMLIFICCDNSHYRIGELDLLLEQGRFQFTDFTEKIVFYHPEEKPKTRGIARLEEISWPVQPEMFQYQLNVYNFLLDLLNDGSRPNHSYKNAFEVLRVCELLRNEGKTAK